MTQRKPSARYDHVFAIIRVDTFSREHVEPETAITVKKIVWTQQEAETEVARLNRLNKEKGCRYFWQTTRLEPKDLGTARLKAVNE